MTFDEELYFEITMNGAKSDVKKMAQFLTSGELDDFFEITDDYINFDDSYYTSTDSAETSLVFSNDSYGIEIDEFDKDDFLEILCQAGRQLEIVGTLYDINDEEFNFKSDRGSSYYQDSSKSVVFNEDELIKDEDSDED